MLSWAPRMPETALILPVPDAEPLVGAWRARLDRSAAAGCPAHITLLYPFIDADEITALDVEALTAIFTSTPALDVAFHRTGRYAPRVLYAAPEPIAPILALAHRIWDRWPRCTPYRGAVARDAIRPHLTVADVECGADGDPGPSMDAAERAVRAGLPLRTRLPEAWLIEEIAGRWTLRTRFGLR